MGSYMSLSHTDTVFMEIQAPGLEYAIPCCTILRDCRLTISGLTYIFAENAVFGITSSFAMLYRILIAFS
jgi:hypothetical protein